MKLKKLLRAEELSSRSTKIIKLDYSHIEGIELPKTTQLPSDTEIAAQEQIKNAEKEAKLLIDAARTEAERIQYSVKKRFELDVAAIEQEYQEKGGFLQKEYDQKKKDLEEEYTIKYEDLEREKKDIEIQLVQAKEDIRKSIIQEITEEVSKETRERVRGEYTQLIKQVHAILDQAIDRRRDLLKEFENEVADLIILVVQKIVKIISEENRSVIIKNVHQSLSMLKDREHFLIHVNTIDMHVLRDEIDAIKKILSIKGLITVVEDSSVEPGGCVIETELGEVDARISTQLLEMSNKIRESSSIKHAKF